MVRVGEQARAWVRWVLVRSAHVGSSHVLLTPPGAHKPEGPVRRDSGSGAERSQPARVARTAPRPHRPGGWNNVHFVPPIWGWLVL